MSESNGKSRNLGQEARMIMHEDEHAIVKEILRKTLGDDGCFESVVSSGRSESGRAEDRLVLARFFERMERQFALRAEARFERENRSMSSSRGWRPAAAPAARERRPNGADQPAPSGAAG